MTQRLDCRRHLHAVVRRRRIAARKRLHLLARTHDADCPAARPVRIPKARAVRIDMAERCVIRRFIRSAAHCGAFFAHGRTARRRSFRFIEERRQRLRRRKPGAGFLLRRKALIACAAKAFYLRAAVLPCKKDSRRTSRTHGIKFLSHFLIHTQTLFPLLPKSRSVKTSQSPVLHRTSPKPPVPASSSATPAHPCAGNTS